MGGPSAGHGVSPIEDNSKVARSDCAHRWKLFQKTQATGFPLCKKQFATFGLFAARSEKEVLTLFNWTSTSSVGKHGILNADLQMQMHMRGIPDPRATAVRTYYYRVISSPAGSQK